MVKATKHITNKPIYHQQFAGETVAAFRADLLHNLISNTLSSCVFPFWTSFL